MSVYSLIIMLHSFHTCSLPFSLTVALKLCVPLRKSSTLTLFLGLWHLLQCKTSPPHLERLETVTEPPPLRSLNMHSCPEDPELMHTVLSATNITHCIGCPHYLIMYHSSKLHLFYLHLHLQISKAPEKASGFCQKCKSFHCSSNGCFMNLSGKLNVPSTVCFMWHYFIVLMVWGLFDSVMLSDSLAHNI